MLTLDRASVDRVEKQPTGDNFMLSGMLALRKPDFLEAAGLLKRSLDSGAGTDRQILRFVVGTVYVVAMCGEMLGTQA